MGVLFYCLEILLLIVTRRGKGNHTESIYVKRGMQGRSTEHKASHLGTGVFAERSNFGCVVRFLCVKCHFSWIGLVARPAITRCRLFFVFLSLFLCLSIAHVLLLGYTQIYARSLGTCGAANHQRRAREERRHALLNNAILHTTETFYTKFNKLCNIHPRDPSNKAGETQLDRGKSEVTTTRCRLSSRASATQPLRAQYINDRRSPSAS